VVSGDVDRIGAALQPVERAIDQRFAPGRQMRRQREYDGRRVSGRRRLKRLRA